MSFKLPRPVILCAAVCAGLLSAPAQAGDAQRASSKSPDLGAVGRLGEGDATRAARLVRTGKVYSLAMVTSAHGPNYGDRIYRVFTYPVLFDGKPTLGTNKVSGHDDFVTLNMGIGTQLDGLGHVGSDGVHYGNVPASDFWTPTGLKRFGIEGVPPIVTRGVLLDVAAALGKARLDAGYAISRADLEAAMARQKTRIDRNDVVLVHTGWMDLVEKDPATYAKTEPGLTVEAAEYLAALGAVAVGADNWALEAVPGPVAGEFYTVHQTLLAKHGIHIMENVVTRDLAADKVYEFMFTLAVPRYEGAVQGSAHPVAIR